MSEEVHIIEDMIGRAFDRVFTVDDDELVFDGRASKVRFFHNQDCCESVTIEDIAGDLADLAGEPILQAEEFTKDGDDEDAPKAEYSDEVSTWTFYKFATRKGSVTVRWFGTSNGYYATDVDWHIEEKSA